MIKIIKEKKKKELSQKHADDPVAADVRVKSAFNTEDVKKKKNLL